MRNISSLMILLAVLLGASAFLNVEKSYGADISDCLTSDLDSCDFDGLDKLCNQLFSNPQPCDELCRKAFSGDTVGTCLICCNNLKAQLNLKQTLELKIEK